MKPIKTMSFRLDRVYADLIERDAADAFTNESAILRQIISEHYKNDPGMKRSAGRKSSMLAPGLRQQTPSHAETES